MGILRRKILDSIRALFFSVWSMLTGPELQKDDGVHDDMAYDLHRMKKYILMKLRCIHRCLTILY